MSSANGRWARFPSAGPGFAKTRSRGQASGYDHEAGAGHPLQHCHSLLTTVCTSKGVGEATGQEVHLACRSPRAPGANTRMRAGRAASKSALMSSLSEPPAHSVTRPPDGPFILLSPR